MFLFGICQAETMLEVMGIYVACFISLCVLLLTNRSKRLKDFMSGFSGTLQSKPPSGIDQPLDPLRAFLMIGRKASEKKFKEFRKVHVVIGNEACDLDSTVSAIALSFRNSKVDPSCDVVHLPVLNIQRDDFPLRTDIKHVLSQLGIDDSLLTFQSDVDLHGLHHEGKLRLSLVDFHILPKKDELLEDDVIEIVDHRPPERIFSERIHVTMKIVGSCSTLVTNFWFTENLEMPQALIKMFYSAIIIDTICMSETAGKKTEDDEFVVRKLEALDPNLVNLRQKIFDDIHKARIDVSGLTSLELLRKDLKVISRDETPCIAITMSSIEENLQVFLKRTDVELSLKAFTEQRKASAAVLMFLSIDQNKQLTRQLAVYSLDSQLRQQICHSLEDSKDPSLHLSKIDLTTLNFTTFYRQSNEKASRKAVLPILRYFLLKFPRCGSL